MAGCQRCLTHVAAAGLDDNGTSAARLLLGLGHALPGLLVGVVRGAYRDLVLDAAQAVQLHTAISERIKTRSSFHISTRLNKGFRWYIGRGF